MGPRSHISEMSSCCLRVKKVGLKSVCIIFDYICAFLPFLCLYLLPFSVYMCALIILTLLYFVGDKKALWGAGVKIAAAVRSQNKSVTELHPQSIIVEITDLKSGGRETTILEGHNQIDKASRSSPTDETDSYEDKGGEETFFEPQTVRQNPVTFIPDFGSFPPNFRSPSYKLE